MSATRSAVETLDPIEVARLLERGSILLIDVREPAEFVAERIPGAVLFPLSTFDATKLPADALRRVVFHCGSGKHSAVAAERRLACGERAAHLGGGLLAWKAAGLPVIAAGPATRTPRQASAQNA